MKIGVVTIAGGENFGCALQTYAVIKSFEKLGHEAVLIDDTTKNGVRTQYQKRSKLSKCAPSYMLSVIKVRLKTKYMMKNQRDRLIPSMIRRKKHAALYAKAKALRVKNFKDFYDRYIPKTDYKINSKDNLKEKLSEFDFFSAGSDQVWNPIYPHTSEVRFLTFAENHQKLTFAPSFGISEIPEYAKAPYKAWLSEFPVISVREQRGAEIIKELTGKDATVICDPTMTLTKAEWEEIEAKPSFDCSKPYILTYFLGNESNKYRRYIENTAKEKGLEIINLFDIRETEFYSVDPSGFIYLIHHASAVFTDSFHAAVFSIIFQKDFMVFDRIEDGRSMGSRLKTLLGKFSLSHRLYSADSVNAFQSVDFNKAEKILEEERNTAIDFLVNSIAHQTSKNNER